MCEHQWKYMYRVEEEGNWYHCGKCIAECCQKFNPKTGELDRAIFDVRQPAKKPKKGLFGR